MMRGSVQITSTPISGMIGLLEVLLGKPVVDETGLAGSYSFALTFDRTDPATLMEAMSRELGLVIESATREVPVTVVRRLPG
jgi:uncharacterized protein (TIGR03435 family)